MSGCLPLNKDIPGYSYKKSSSCIQIRAFLISEENTKTGKKYVEE